VTRVTNGQPSVSVIVPVRDGQATIADCLDAILATNYPDDRREILVVDNGSTDDTAVLIRSLRRRSRSPRDSVAAATRSPVRRRSPADAQTRSVGHRETSAASGRAQTRARAT